MSSNYAGISPSDTGIILVDHQPGVLAMVGSLPTDLITNNAATLGRLGEEMGIPLLVTSTRENLEFLGSNLPAIQAAAPKAYENRVARAGTLNAFHDPTFVKAVEDLGRPNLVMAGLLTDVCLFHSVVSALEAGYRVIVVADASGTSSSLADAVTYDRLRDAGAEIASTWGVLFELYEDLSTPEGQQAEAIASSSVRQAA
jgi:nicotinamidase-related amidase